MGGSFLPAKIIHNLGANSTLINIYPNDTLEELLDDEFSFKIFSTKAKLDAGLPTKTRYTFNGNRIFRVSELSSHAVFSGDVQTEITELTQKN